MRLTTGNFKECFGGMTKECRQEIGRYDFSYDIVAPPDLNAQNLKVIGDRGRWEDGWAENLATFKSSHDINDLTPKYYHPGRVLRYKDNYIQPVCPDFELNFLKVFRSYIFSFLKRYNPVYEFGCGTGFNLVTLAEMFPDKELHGLDWAESSVKLLGEINQACNLDIKRHHFDMFHPDEIDIPDNSAIFTWGALEQLGDKWEPFLQFLLQKNIFVINIEPIAELYNPDNDMDSHSIQYMEKRGYLKDWLPRLYELESSGQIKIDRVQRQHFGNMNYEGWSFIVWRVKCNTRELAISHSPRLGRELRVLKMLA